MKIKLAKNNPPDIKDKIMSISRKVYLEIILVFIATAMVYYHFPAQSDTESSVRCVRDQSNNKMCRIGHGLFANYSFHLFLKENSVITGLTSYQQLKTIQLSSVKQHNRFYANMSTFNYEHRRTHYCSQRSGRVLVLARFKPDNLMHVIHDDLLPLFATLENICPEDWEKCLSELSLMLIDGHGQGPYLFLYKLFANKIIFSDDVRNCVEFKEIYVGLNLDTVWYQYGFNEPRGPVNKSFVTSHTLLRFKSFLLSRLQIHREKNFFNIVILNRLMTRKIVNVNNVVKMARFVYGEKVNCTVLNISSLNTLEILQHVAGASVMIGMHGADLILSLFLPTGTKVIEIMPYGIPSNVSYLKALYDLNVTHFSYFMWSNENSSNTIRHLEYPPHLGGLQHLPLQKRTEINNLKQIGNVFCCDDPKFLFFMYQDTIVGHSFKTALLAKPGFNLDASVSIWLFPGPVLSLKCVKYLGDVKLSWISPTNLADKVTYSVLLEIDGKNEIFETKDLDHSLKRKVTRAWVTAVCDVTGRTSLDSFTMCT